MKRSEMCLTLFPAEDRPTAINMYGFRKDTCWKGCERRGEEMIMLMYFSFGKRLYLTIGVIEHDQMRRNAIVQLSVNSLTERSPLNIF